MIRWLPAIAGVVFGIALVTFFVGRAMTGESQEGTSDVRYGNVVLTVPKPGTSEVVVAHNPPATDAQPRWRIQVYVELPPEEGELKAEWPTLEIDSQTGEIVSDTLSAARPELANPILASLRVDASPPEAVWPYDGAAAPGDTQQFGNVQYYNPDPLSGIMVFVKYVFCVPEATACASRTLTFLNSQSSIDVSAIDGTVLSRSIESDDTEAFVRLAEAVVIVASPAPAVARHAELHVLLLAPQRSLSRRERRLVGDPRARRRLQLRRSRAHMR